MQEIYTLRLKFQKKSKQKNSSRLQNNLSNAAL
jgi:hypothetical protein